MPSKRHLLDTVASAKGRATTRLSAAARARGSATTRLSAAKLYVIVDADVLHERDPVVVAMEAVSGGADIIQWRAKTWTMRERWQAAERLSEALRPTRALLIINDHVDLSLAVEADGVHLGQDDLPIEVARRWMGSQRIIGVSTHSLPQAVAAQAHGADYIGVGPIFATPTKPGVPPVGLELLTAVRGAVTIPFVAIGGIDQTNLPLVLSAGTTRVAVVRAVAGAHDVQGAAQRLKAMLGCDSGGAG